jgi:hypothetical protein
VHPYLEGETRIDNRIALQVGIDGWRRIHSFDAMKQDGLEAILEPNG